MKRWWFFDLDGTLADTDADIRLAWKTALKALGLESPDFDEKFVTGPPIDEVVKTLFPDRYSPELIADARRAFGLAYDASGFPNTREYPGVRQLLLALKAAGARLFIVTNKRYVGAKLMAAKFGWGEIFEGLYAGDMYATPLQTLRLRKPELLARVLRELGAAPDESVLVGDTTSDFEAAAANGIESVGVTWGYGTDAELAQATRLASRAEDIWKPNPV